MFRSRSAANLARIILDILIREVGSVRLETLKSCPPLGQVINDSDSCQGNECCAFLDELIKDENVEGKTLEENIELLKSDLNLDAPNSEYPGETIEVPVLETVESVIEEEKTEETLESF